MTQNIDPGTVRSFGDEWSRFDQSALGEPEIRKIFDEYFSVFPWADLPPDAEGFDMGCGTGRWAKLVAPRVGRLHCIDPSRALDVARENLAALPNVSFHLAGVDDAVLAEGTQDFGYSLGVLHHVPDTAAGIARCVRLLKPGAPFLLYLYYAFDNRGLAYKTLWKTSDLLRRVICRLPPAVKHATTDLIAASVYWPLARGALAVEKLGAPVKAFPLSYYRNHSFYTMRTDSRDRFGTPLERRFTREQVAEMMASAGLERVRFSVNAPYWCAVGWKK